MSSLKNSAVKAALDWYIDQGVDEAIGDEALDRRGSQYIQKSRVVPSAATVDTPSTHSHYVNLNEGESEAPSSRMAGVSKGAPPLLGKSDAQAEAVKLANAAGTLEELREAIAEFEGIALKKTATNLVFCDGNPRAHVMLVGEAPGADEDRMGKPFVGVSGQLLDRILKFIDLDRSAEEPEKALYISNILNWRPPGNRTPSPAEIHVSLPFIEKHIALVQPKILILCGGVSAKSLLGSTQGISRLRKTWHDYKLQTFGLSYDGPAIPAIATYHPAYLLRTPAQKKAVWADMLSLDEKRRNLGLK